MNENRQMEVPYINTGFPYTVTESFMDLFEGLVYTQADVTYGDAFQGQASPYWSTMYKYGYSGPGSNIYYSYSHVYNMDDYIHRFDAGSRAWESSPVNNVECPDIAQQGIASPHESSNSGAEECLEVHQNSSTSQAANWHDNVDPDNMTYEELLDLGEAVGTQSRGLSKERISLLPVSKYKCGLFSRRKARGERCVICQMNYKRGDRRMTLPCKHIYHANCVARWLGINKVCPVCFAEVQLDGPKRQ